MDAAGLYLSANISSGVRLRWKTAGTLGSAEQRDPNRAENNSERRERVGKRRSDGISQWLMAGAGGVVFGIGGANGQTVVFLEQSTVEQTHLE
jgi:hypothetical protein